MFVSKHNKKDQKFCTRECHFRWQSIHRRIYVFCSVCQSPVSKNTRKNRRRRGWNHSYCSRACYLYRVAQRQFMKNVVLAEWQAIRKATQERLAREMKQWYDGGGCFWQMRNYFLKLPRGFWDVAPQPLKNLANSAIAVARKPKSKKKYQEKRRIKAEAERLAAIPILFDPTGIPEKTLADLERRQKSLAAQMQKRRSEIKDNHAVPKVDESVATMNAESQGRIDEFTASLPVATNH